MTTNLSDATLTRRDDYVVKLTFVDEDGAAVDITARAIGIYNETGQYLYTGGSFVADGATYSTVCPVGQRTANESVIYFKLLLGAAPEGEWTLPIGKQLDTRQFWGQDQ